jgi:tetratricopeptide (TPR) repeat protein
MTQEAICNAGALQEAVALHQAGDLGGAAAIYVRLLEANHENADAWHLLGLIASDQARPVDAVDFLCQAIRLAPDVALYRANLGLALGREERWSEAAECYAEADILEPGNPKTLGKLGRALARLGRFEPAVAALRQALDASGGDADTWNALGSALADSGEMEEAAHCFEEAIRRNASHDEARANLHSAGQHWARQGEEASLRQDWEKAVPALERAVRCAPGEAMWRFNLGLALTAVRRLDEAQAEYEAALRIQPEHAESWNNLGHVLLALGDSGRALDAYRRALQWKPEYVDARYNLGVALQGLDRAAEARREYQAVLERIPQHADSLNNLGGIALAGAGPEEAIPYYRAAIGASPGHPDARWNLGLAHLSLGNFREGWKGYEARLERPEFRAREFPCPRWNGEALSGSRIHVWAEQGLGDTIQFARYLPMVEARGGTIVFECQERLRPLVKTAGILLSEDSAASPCAYHAPLLSLPGIFETELDSIPAPGPRYEIPGELRESWAARIGRSSGPRVGLVWSANAANLAGRNRSLPAEALAPLAGVANVKLFSLQRGLAPHDCTHFPWLTPLEAEDTSILDTAAAMMELDLIVTVDTMTAHLAATLGRPTWILLPFAADWRWMRGRSDSPWYPAARLFRQPEPGNWAAVVAAVRQALEEFAP